MVGWRGQGIGHVRSPDDRAVNILSNNYNCGEGYKYSTNRSFEGVGVQATYQYML
jgi:hypothetical protein